MIAICSLVLRRGSLIWCAILVCIYFLGLNLKLIISVFIIQGASNNCFKVWHILHIAYFLSSVDSPGWEVFLTIFYVSFSMRYEMVILGWTMVIYFSYNRWTLFHHPVQLRGPALTQCRIKFQNVWFPNFILYKNVILTSPLCSLPHCHLN